MTNKMTLEQSMKSLMLKFTSGNSIDVERATITRDEFDAIDAHIAGMGEPAAVLTEIYNEFGIGREARTQGAVLTIIRNIMRFASQQAAIEGEFFMVPGEPDEDFPDDKPEDDCLLNRWGSTTEQYVEQFREALKRIAPPASGDWDKVREVIVIMRSHAGNKNHHENILADELTAALPESKP